MKLNKRNLIFIFLSLFLIFGLTKVNYPIIKFFILSILFFIAVSFLPIKTKEIKFKLWAIIISAYLSLLSFEVFLKFLYNSRIPINDDGKRIIINSRTYHHDYRPSQHFYNKL